MLSDKFIRNNQQNLKNNVDNKIRRLEHLSISMANLIS